MVDAVQGVARPRTESVAKGAVAADEDFERLAVRKRHGEGIVDPLSFQIQQQTLRVNTPAAKQA